MKFVFGGRWSQVWQKFWHDQSKEDALSWMVYCGLDCDEDDGGFVVGVRLPLWMLDSCHPPDSALCTHGPRSVHFRSSLSLFAADGWIANPKSEALVRCSLDPTPTPAARLGLAFELHHPLPAYLTLWLPFPFLLLTPFNSTRSFLVSSSVTRIRQERGAVAGAVGLSCCE